MSEIVYPSDGGTALKPQIREGWRTYNFEVEDLHTYIAGGLRVHNTSLPDLVPDGADKVVFNDTDGDGKLDKADYELPGGVRETIYGWDTNGDNNTDLVKRIKTIPREELLGPQDKVVWEETYQGTSTVPSEKKIIGIEYAPGTLQGEEAGRTLGSVLGSAIGGSNIFAQVGSATITATLLQNVGELLQTSVDLSLLSLDGHNVSPLEAAITDTFKDFGQDLVGNAKVQVINALSGVIVGEIADALNLQGFERGLFSTVGNTVTNQVLGNVAQMLGIHVPGTVVNSNVNLLSGFDAASMASNLANSLGGFFGSQLGQQAVRAHNEQASLFGSATWIGGPDERNAVGGAGRDTISYAYTSAGMIIDLNANPQRTWNGHAGDNLFSIENAIGSYFNDTIIGSAGDNAINGGAGDDTIYGNQGHDWVDGGAGNDFIAGGSGNDSLYGSDGNDTIHGEEDDDVIAAGNGNDVVTGGNGNDTIDGEEGNDYISGGSGNDAVYAGSGNDTIDGEDGDDFIAAGSGNDAIYSGNGNDQLHGEEGDDYIAAGTGNDAIYGGTGNDGIHGEEGDDYIAAGSGNDAVYGGSGYDDLYGEDGDDFLMGNSEDDWLSGGRGRDVFGFGPGDGRDIIRDFTTGGSEADVIAFNSGVMTSFDAVRSASWQEGGDLMIAVTQDTSIRLQNVDLNNLSTSNFTFS